MIPQDKMLVVWNSTLEEGVSELAVVNIDQQNSRTDGLLKSAGASDDDWLKGDPICTPMGLFTEIAAVDGFKDDDVAVAAIREFAQVEGQGAWTDSLLKSFGR